MVGMTLLDTNETLIRTLMDGLELETARTEFRRVWNKHDFKVKTFQEAHGVTGINFVGLNSKVSCTIAV